MDFQYEILFMPRNSDIEETDEIRKVVYTESKRLDSRDKVKQKARDVSVRENIIDEFAMRRNYWKIIGGEGRITNHSWTDISEVREYLESKDCVDGISGEGDDWNHTYIEAYFDSRESRKQERQNLRNRFNEVLPIVTRRKYLRITTKSKIKFNDHDIDDVLIAYDKIS